MRFFEFAGDDAYLDKFVIILRNYIGRAASKKAPSNLNWNGLGQVAKSNGFEFAADYETFKSMYDSNPVIQQMVKNFNADGIELNVPGAPDDKAQQTPNGGKDSEETVANIAAGAAAGQLAQSQAGVQA